MTLTKERINLVIEEIKTLLEQYDIDKVDDMITDDISKIIKRNPIMPITEEEIKAIKIPVTLKFFELYCKAHNSLRQTSTRLQQVAHIKEGSPDLTPQQLIGYMSYDIEQAYTVFSSFLENCVLEESMYGKVCTYYISHGEYRDLYSYICGDDKNPILAFTTGRILNAFLKCEFPETNIIYENIEQKRKGLS